MKYQVVATFREAHKRYLELAEQDNYYSKVYLKDTSCYPLATYNDLHAVDVDYYERYYEVVNYSWHDDAIIFVLQSKEDMTMIKSEVLNKDAMGDIPYADSHYGTVRIIIDIEFIDGTFTRGILAHSIKFEPAEQWNLKIYKTQEDVFKQKPILYWGVKNIEVVGLLDSPKVFRDTAIQTKAFTDAIQHKVYKGGHDND